MLTRLRGSSLAGRNWLPPSAHSVPEDAEGEEQGAASKPCGRSDVALLLLGTVLLVAFIMAGLMSSLDDSPLHSPALRSLGEHSAQTKAEELASASPHSAAALLELPGASRDQNLSSVSTSTSLGKSDSARRSQRSMRVGMGKIMGKLAVVAQTAG